MEIQTLMFLPPCQYILNLHEVHESPEYIIMIFEYMAGKDLYHRIKTDRRLSEEKVFGYFLQMIKGLLFLHSHGFCHRDIKPDNILFVDDERLKLADFSLVERKWKMTGVCGTPGYIAPEIFYQDSYNEKVDVFSLGVVLFSM